MYLYIVQYSYCSCWGYLLDICKDDIVTQSSKWWFYIYGLVISDEISSDELINTLVLFMEGSTLGEYDTKLKIIEAFSQQILSEGWCYICCNEDMLFYCHSISSLLYLWSIPGPKGNIRFEDTSPSVFILYIKPVCVLYKYNIECFILVLIFCNLLQSHYILCM